VVHSPARTRVPGGDGEHSASEGLGWHARPLGAVAHFTDFQPGRDDWAWPTGSELNSAVSYTRPATRGDRGRGRELLRRAHQHLHRRHNLTSNLIRTHDSASSPLTRGRATARPSATHAVCAPTSSVDGGGLSTVLSPRIGAVLPTARAGVWRASVGAGSAPRARRTVRLDHVQAFASFRTQASLGDGVVGRAR